MASESAVWTELLNYVLEPLDLFNQGHRAPRTRGCSADEGELPSAVSQSQQLRESHASPRAWSDTLITWANLSCSECVTGAAPRILSLLEKHGPLVLSFSSRIYPTATDPTPTHSHLLQVQQAPKQIYNNYYPILTWFDPIISQLRWWVMYLHFVAIESQIFWVGRDLNVKLPSFYLCAQSISREKAAALPSAKWRKMIPFQLH